VQVPLSYSLVIVMAVTVFMMVLLCISWLSPLVLNVPSLR
jgi:hypothetical protein